MFRRLFFSHLLKLLLLLQPDLSWAASKSSARSSGGGLHTYIPVRLGVMGGYHGSRNSFDADHKNYPNDGLGVGADFNVPIPGIKWMIGLTGWFAFPKTDAYEANRFFMGAAYMGYADGVTDVYLGYGPGILSREVKGDLVAPLEKVSVDITAGCGLLGVRHHWGTSAKVGLGAHLYGCHAKSYDKTLTQSLSVESTSRIASPAWSAGGLVFLLLSWGENRMLH